MMALALASTVDWIGMVSLALLLFFLSNLDILGFCFLLQVRNVLHSEFMICNVISDQLHLDSDGAYSVNT